MSLLERDVVLPSVTDNGEKVIDLPITRVNNVEGLGRCINTTYSIGDMVYADTNKAIALCCLIDGTTSTEEIDFSEVSVGETIVDGEVDWKAIPRGIMIGASPIGAGVEGLVPTPPAGSQNKALCGDGNFRGLDALAGITPITKGGTGATTAKTARANLGISVGQLMPVGSVIAMAANSAPAGYLLCNGAAVSRTTYADLFAAIGTTYGSGNGSTTFNLPNLNNNSFLEGSTTAGTVKSAGLPNAIGSFIGVYGDGGFGTSAYGVFREVGPVVNANMNLDSSKTDRSWYDFSLDRGNPIFGNSDTVQPKSVTVKFCIKY